MKTMKTLIILIIGLSLVLAAGTAFGRRQISPRRPFLRSVSSRETAYADSLCAQVSGCPSHAWGYTRPTTGSMHPLFYREYCAPYAPTYGYAPVYRPGWSVGFSFGW